MLKIIAYAPKVPQSLIVSATIAFALFVLSIALPFSALAQAPNPSAAPNQSAAPNESAAPSQQLLKPEELDALVAPIALYPDALLAEVLMASTYPLEVVEAERWATENKDLKGDELKVALDRQKWDESVKELVATPSVLTMMSTKLDWTKKLGDAVLAQQPDVMDAIQRLRLKAQANGKLESTKEQKVTVKKEGNKEVIYVEPAVPDTIYVPYYEPAVVYGEWPYADYPPYYFGVPSYIPGAVVASGIAFGAGYALGRWTSGGNYWGGGINWNNNNININRPRVNPLGGQNWQHNPAHRQGVRYSNTNVQQRFGTKNVRSGRQERMEFRGRSGQQVLKPGTGRASRGERGGAQRPGAGQRPSQRPSAGQRPSQRPGAGQRPSSRPSARQRPSQRPSAAQRQSTRPRGGQRPSASTAHRSRGNAFGNVQSGRRANAQSQRGRASMGGGRGGPRGTVGAGRGGGGRGGGGRGGGGRRSDIRLKHDVVLLGRLSDGLGFYRFSYNGGHQVYVGVIAQEVQKVMPQAVVRGQDGYLRVFYDKLGLKFETYDQWLASGAKLPLLHPPGGEH